MRTIIDFLETLITSLWGVVKACRTVVSPGSGMAPGAGQEAGPAAGQGSVSRVISAFTELRPLLVALSVFRLIPANGRALLTAFIKALDALTPATNPDFKAGKDV
jgi:hypothetical protein